jgi:hypothetical protein
MTSAEMDIVMEMAQNFAGDRARVDRCRHESVTEPALWFFDPKSGKQIGSVSRQSPIERWKGNRMMHGMPVSEFRHGSLHAAVEHIFE